MRLGVGAHQKALGAQVLLATFVAVLVIEDVAERSLSPLSHQVSEYATQAGLGWLMTVGFVCWAASLSLTAALGFTAASWAGPRQWARALIGGLMALASAGMVLTAVTHTQTVADVLPPGRHLTGSGRLHDLGSGVTTLALFAAAVVGCFVSGRHNLFGRASALAVLSSLVLNFGLLIVGPSVGGLRQRLLLLVACAWQAGLIRKAASEA